MDEVEGILFPQKGREIVFQKGGQRWGMYGALKDMAYTRSLQCLDLIRIRHDLGYDILWVDMIDPERQEFLSDS